MGELWRADAVELVASIRAGAVSPLDVAEAVIGRIEEENEGVNAIVAWDPERLRARAQSLEKARRTSGDSLPPLFGVPVTIKDLSPAAGLPFTFGLPSHRGVVAETDALIVRRLVRDGAMIVGKTNTSEAGYCALARNGLFGPTENPWRRGMTTGGSSGGAAAAVAMGFGPLASGSDGAGSIRIPASLCGVVGLKPTRGFVPFESALWTEVASDGPIGRSVADVALMLATLRGYDRMDPFGCMEEPSGSAGTRLGELGRLRIGLVRDFGLAPVDDAVWASVERAAARLDALGARVQPLELDWTGAAEGMWGAHWLPLYAQFAETCDWEAERQTVEPELSALVAEARQLSARDQAKALLRCRELAVAFAATMEEFDVLLSPTTCTTAFPHCQFAPDHLAGSTLQEQLLGWFLTYPFNILGAPALSVPVEAAPTGLPVGLQVVADRGLDDLVLAVGAAIESTAPRKVCWE